MLAPMTFIFFKVRQAHRRRATHAPRPRDARITVGRTIEEVERLRPQFERLPPASLDADLDYFLMVVRHRQGVIRPHVMLFELPGGRELRVVARLEERRSGLREGRAVRFLQVSLGGVVGADTASDCALVVQALNRALSEGEADVVVLPQLQVDGALYHAARSGTPRWRGELVRSHDIHWRADVPDSLKAFLGARSSNTRYNVRRYSKRLVQAHGDSLTMREFRVPGDLDCLCADLETIAAKTYQRGLGVGYMGNPMQLALMKLGASRGWLRAWVLYVADLPVAFWFGYCYRGTFNLSATAFDPAHGDLRVGQHLQMQIMESLCAEEDVHSFDYGIGEAEYKRRFGDHCIEQADVLLFAPSIKAFRINAKRTARVGATRLARAWIARSQLGRRAKKRWRNRAERRARSRLSERGSRPTA
jgi:hypothetical protein